MDEAQVVSSESPEGQSAGVEVYRSGDLLARFRAGHNSAACVITFNSYSDNRTLDRAGFGEPFLSKQGIDANSRDLA